MEGKTIMIKNPLTQKDAEKIVDCFAEIYKGTKSVDNLVQEPMQAIWFCEQVRMKLKVEWKDFFILNKLMGQRKKSDPKTHKNNGN